jgi:hypothetical protein
MVKGDQRGRCYTMDSEFLGTRRAADLAELSVTGINLLIRSGRLPAYRVFFGGTRRYRVLVRRSELVEFITSEKYDGEALQE